VAGLTNAAETVLQLVQDELRHRESPLDPDAGHELGGAKAWALLVLIEDRGVSKAKKLELQIAEGRPLTICTGRTWKADEKLAEGYERRGERPWLWTPPPLLFRVAKTQAIHRGRAVTVQVPAFGCFRIIEDSPRTNAHDPRSEVGLLCGAVCAPARRWAVTAPTLQR